MGEIVCSLIYKDAQHRDMVLPDHIPVHQLVNSIATALGLPTSRDILYDLSITDGSEIHRIPGSRTLQQAYVLDGSYLHLTAEKQDASHAAFLESSSGMRIRLRENTIIGRLTPEIHVDVDLSPLDHGRVASRNHASITHVSAHYVIKDLGSHNGTFINEIILQKGQSVVLHPGDEICFGGLEKGVRLKYTV